MVNARHRFRITFRKNSYVKHVTAKLACNILLFFVFAHAKTYHAHSRAFLISTLKHWRARLYFTWWLFIILKFLFRVICFHKLKTRNVQGARAPFSCLKLRYRIQIWHICGCKASARHIILRARIVARAHKNILARAVLASI